LGINSSWTISSLLFYLLFYDLAARKINCCGNVRTNCKGMPPDFGRKTMRLKTGDIQARTRGHMTALVWKDRRDFIEMSELKLALAQREEEFDNVKTSLVEENASVARQLEETKVEVQESRVSSLYN
jgi:hypothetical protein